MGFAIALAGLRVVLWTDSYVLCGLNVDRTNPYELQIQFFREQNKEIMGWYKSWPLNLQNLQNAGITKIAAIESGGVN